MGHLRENPHAVTRLTLRVLSGTVLQILHNLKRILHDGAALLALDIDAGADTTVVMFKFRPVEGGFWDGCLYIKHKLPPCQSLKLPIKKVSTSV